MSLLAVAVVGYLLGSLPVSPWVARAHGIDLRRTSDGNPGAWNVLEQLGPRRAWPAFLGDGLKGLAAGLVGLWLGPDGSTSLLGLTDPGMPAVVVGVAAAMLGHAFPLFARLRGGKSVMTFVGGAFVVCLPAALIALVLCVVATRASRFAVGARIGVVAFPVAQAAVASIDEVAATGALMCIIGIRFLARRGPRGAERPAS